MSTLTAPTDPQPRPEHPHRCTAGHRWQHGGPTAAACTIPPYDLVSGDLPLVGAEQCPVCCGRDDLLVRDLHAHYCNMCDGDWEHEGRCVDSLAACCPWCFPGPGSEPTPGARRGPHFHVCSDCGQNWRHAIGCAAPLRVALPECIGCRSPLAGRDGEPREMLPIAAVPGSPGPLAGRRGPLAVSLGIAAVVVLSAVIGLARYQGFRLETAKIDVPAVDARGAEPRPTPIAPALPSLPARPPAAPLLPPLPAPAKITPDPPKRPASASRRARPVSPGISRSAPVRAEPRVEAARPLPSAPSPAGAAQPPRSVARSEPTPETPPRAPAIAGIRSEPAPRATPVREPPSGIPGAPPFGTLGGSSGVDRSLEGHPRRVAR
jgi:hypothetical protein